jgi:hypothetical protein
MTLRETTRIVAGQGTARWHGKCEPTRALPHHRGKNNDGQLVTTLQLLVRGGPVMFALPGYPWGARGCSPGEVLVRAGVRSSVFGG